MPLLSITTPDGVSRRVEMGDFYDDLSYEDQLGVQQHLRDSPLTLTAPPDSSRTTAGSVPPVGPWLTAPNASPVGPWLTMPNVPPAQQGASAPAPADATPSPDTSFSGALRHGFYSAARGIGRTVSDYLGAPNVGAAIAGAVDDTPNYQTAASGLGDAIKAGHLGDALAYVPRTVVENLPDLAATAGAGVAGGPLGIAAYTGARTLGTNADASAASHGHATPDSGDLINGGVLSAGEAGLAALGGPLAGRYLAGTVGRAGGSVLQAAREMSEAYTTAAPLERAVMTAPISYKVDKYLYNLLAGPDDSDGDGGGGDGGPIARARIHAGAAQALELLEREALQAVGIVE